MVQSRGEQHLPQQGSETQPAPCHNSCYPECLLDEGHPIAANAIGTACTRADERTAAAFGLADSAATRFEPATDILLGGVLCGLPALCANGLFSGLDRHLTLPKGYYSALHILCVLGFMALARIRRPEQLRHHPPGELGKAIGLDRVPEVRTLREKIARMAATGNPGQWMRDLSKTWMENDPTKPPSSPPPATSPAPPSPGACSADGARKTTSAT